MFDIASELKRNLGDGVLVNEPLSKYTNFKIGGPAHYFFVANNITSLVKALQTANELELKAVVLGGGTNVLISDQGVDGLVIKVKDSKVIIKGQSVIAAAGVNLGSLVQQVVAVGLAGLEPLVGVPGTVGGAVYGNVGLPQLARGFIGDWVKSVTVFRNDKMIKLAGAKCGFAYRDSVFKHNDDIILEVEFILDKGNSEVSRQLMQKYWQVRQGQPYNLPSSGCIFANVLITDPAELRQKFAGEEKLEQFIKAGQLPASWLIDRAGLKGKTIGSIQVSVDHANYLVNCGGGTAEQVIMMISYIKQQVRDKFGFQLQEEIRYLGF